MLSSVLSAAKRTFVVEEYETYREKPVNRAGNAVIKPLLKEQALSVIAVIPRSFSEAKMYAQEILSGKALLVSYEKMDISERGRAFDYLNGVAYTVATDVRRVSQHVIVYTPAHVSTDVIDTRVKRGFFK